MQRILFILLFSVSTFFCSAQMNSGFDAPLSERISFGGNVGLNFGDITAISISPTVGYRFTEKFTGGIGVLYNYVEYSKKIYGIDFSTNSYGGKVFGRYRFLENIYGSLEYQTLNLAAYDFNSFEPIGRINVPMLFVGGGYLQQIGEKSFINFALQYDLIQDTYSPYGNPLISIGFLANP